MKTSKIIQVEVNFQHDLIAIKGSQSTYSYYSNLSVAYKAITSTLILNGWDVGNLNYTALYRSLKSKKSYTKVFKVKGTPFFKLSVTYRTLNPKLDSLDLIRHPL